MRTTTVTFDEKSQTEIDLLKKAFGATTNAAAIRKALTLAALVARVAGDSRSVTISGPNPGKPINVLLSA